MKTAVKHCVSSAYQIGTGGGVEGRRGLAPPPIRFGKCRLSAAPSDSRSGRLSGVILLTRFSRLSLVSHSGRRHQPAGVFTTSRRVPSLSFRSSMHSSGRKSHTSDSCFSIFANSILSSMTSEITESVLRRHGSRTRQKLTGKKRPAPQYMQNGAHALTGKTPISGRAFQTLPSEAYSRRAPQAPYQSP